MEECPAPLEQIFQKVEQESERRAQLNDSDGAPFEKAVNAATAKRLKQKRRGSVSISRIGQNYDPDVHPTKDSMPRSPSSLAFATNSPYFQSQLANSSTTSIASGASEYSNEHAHDEDTNHVTQMHHIAGKPSISSKIIPRRLSRAHSTSVMPSWVNKNAENTVIIGVSIQEAITHSVREEVDGEGDVVNRSRRASVVARGPVRKQASQNSLKSRLVESSWLSRAKLLTQKFRRKPKAATPHAS